MLNYMKNKVNIQNYKLFFKKIRLSIIFILLVIFVSSNCYAVQNWFCSQSEAYDWIKNWNTSFPLGIETNWHYYRYRPEDGRKLDYAFWCTDQDCIDVLNCPDELSPSFPDTDFNGVSDNEEECRRVDDPSFVTFSTEYYSQFTFAGFYETSGEVMQLYVDYNGKDYKVVYQSPQSVYHTFSGIGFSTITALGYLWIVPNPANPPGSLCSVDPFSSVDTDGDGDGIPDSDDLDSYDKKDLYLGVDPENDQTNKCQNKQLDPINIFNGNLIENETDLAFNTPFEKGLIFQRYYNSQSTDDSSMGFGWTHNYNTLLKPNFNGSDQLIEIIDSTGRGIYFEDNDRDGIFRGAFTENSSISINQDGDYVWARDDGAIYKFAQITGLLLSITDKNGNIQNLTYNAANLLETIADLSSGRTLTLQYNSSNKIGYIIGPVTLSVPDGIWVSYTYDANNNLTRVEYADNNNGSSASGFDYRYEDPNNPNNLTSKRDLSGTLLSTWTYNIDDQTIANINNQGKSGSIDYTDPNAVAVTDAYGITSTYTIEEIAGRKKILQNTKPDGCTSCSEGIYKTEFDQSTGYPLIREYFNGRVDFFSDYDDNFNPRTTVISSGKPEEKTILKTYHPTLSTPLTISEKSVLADTANPGRNKITIYDYDDPAAPSDTIVPNENPTSLVHRLIVQGFTLNLSDQVVPYELITAMDYNAMGQVISIDGPQPGSSDTINYAYTPNGDVSSVVSPIIGSITFGYDNAGNMIRFVDQNNIETLITYDGRNRQMTAVTDGKISGKTYTSAGVIKSLTDKAGRSINYDYNTQGMLDKITNPAGEYIYYAYDITSNLIEESVFDYQNTQTRSQRYDYGDPANNPDLRKGKPWKSIVRNQDNTADLETVYQYSNGNVSDITDPAGSSTGFIYDTLNRLTEKSEQLSDTENAVTSYTYDNQNNLVSVTDANGNSTVYTYDDAGRCVKLISPDTGTALYTYDASGNMKTKTLNDGRTTQYTYDDLGRVTSILYDDDTQDTIYLYDQNINGMGRLTGMSDASGLYAFFYDALGNMMRVEKTINQTLFTTDYLYDNAGNITDITYPDGRTVTYGYNISGNVDNISTSRNGVTQVLADTITYLPFGPVQTMAFGNSQVQLKTFDLQYRPSTMAVPGILDLSYGYDLAGNITEITDVMDLQKNLSFSYDKTGRLVQSSGPLGNIDFTYDPVGNRLTRTQDTQTQTYTYINGTNRLLSIADGENPIVDLTYDNNGNIAAKGDKTFEYSQNNRLISASANNNNLGSYIYNSFGQRSQKTANDKTTLFHYDLGGNLIAESDDKGNISKSYIYLGSQRIAVFETSQDQNFVIQVKTDNGRSLNGVKVYVFNENDYYTGVYATTDENGQAVFEKNLFISDVHKFRADYLNDQFWSEPVSLSSNATTITVNETSQSVRVIQNNSSLEGITVYLFDENGKYLGIKAVTDSQGFVWFNLPEGEAYSFRADIMGAQFFSATIAIDSQAQDIVVDSQGGILDFFLTKSGSTPMPGVKTYLFSESGSYLGVNKVTDANGSASFEVPNGSYKIRCDYMGHRFWSSIIGVTSSTTSTLEIPHKNAIFTINTNYQDDTQPLQGVKTYLFTQSGTYLGLTQTTDTSGQVIYSLPEGSFKLRADYLSGQYWSGVTTGNDEVITIAQGVTSLTLTNNGLALPDADIHVFNSSGTYLGIKGSTDSNGNIDFILPKGPYQFRADWMGNQYWTGITQVITDQQNQVSLSTGGGSINLAVKKDEEAVLNGVQCYLFNASGTYLGKNSTTDTTGRISFNLGDGQYKIRCDYMGYKFWTSEFTISGQTNLDLIIPHSQVSIIVNRDNNSTLTPCNNITTYLFTESGVYQGINKTTDENGKAIFDIPQMPYKVRADFMSAQYWSDIFNAQDQTIIIEEGSALIEVKQNTELLENILVYVFDDLDKYLGISGQTNANGLAAFNLPQGTYKFRADYLGTQYWATQSISAHVSNPVSIDTQGGQFTLTLEKEPGLPMQGIKIYAFSSSGTYLGLSASTDESGIVAFDLPDGDYKFRADYLGYQFWREDLSIPTASTAVLSIPHQDVSISVNSQYNAQESMPGVKVYLFTESGSYQGINGTTDSSGNIIFNLPQKPYKARADYLSEQYWTQPFSWADSSITINYAMANLRVTLAGEDITNARVYLFSQSGSYLGKFANTDDQGITQFILPANTYKFRVDYNNTQYWSNPINIEALQENNINLNLDILSLNLTADPYYARYDGKMPEKQKRLLASTNPVIPEGDIDTAEHTVYYFINDHLGTPLKITDSDGQIVWSSDYTPFGSSNVTNSTIENGFRFPGQYYDSETGLHYNYHRYYDPDTGRYLMSDPIGLTGGINPFVYSDNNPINLVDPLGLATVYIWKPGTYIDPKGTQYDSSYGHVAIMSDSGQYLSHHPQKNGFNRFGSKFRSVNEDVNLYGRLSDFQYYVDLPNEKALDLYINKYKSDESFWGVYGNCADSVTGGLEAGGLKAPDLSDGWFDFVSYPDEMRTYLLKINNPNNIVIKDLKVTIP